MTRPTPMRTDRERRLVVVGVVAGATAVVTYLAKTFLPLPGAVSTAFFACRGPLVVIAFVGFYPLLARGATSVGRSSAPCSA